MNTKIVGDYGEQIAKNYLLDKGYEILEQNFVTCGCEVDLICQIGQDINCDSGRNVDIKTKFRFSNNKKELSAKVFSNNKKELPTNGFIEKIKKLLSSGFNKKNIKNINDKTIVFVEVKTRANTQFGRPLEAVTKSKQQRYIRAAKSYMIQHRISNTDIRFDVIEVLENDVTHIESAFEC